MSRKEIITCQLGPFSSYAGAHFWNTQDDARHPVSYDASGDPVYEDQQMDAMVLYRAAHKQLTPRLIVCDAADHFGNLSSAGGVAVPAAPVTAARRSKPLKAALAAANQDRPWLSPAWAQRVSFAATGSARTSSMKE